jgi:curved DNA-binding protein CbpA
VAPPRTLVAEISAVPETAPPPEPESPPPEPESPPPAAENAPPPASVGPPPGIDGLEAFDPDTTFEEERYILSPMVPRSPTDPQGVYGEVTLPQLLYNVFRDIFTGRLRLQRGRVTKEVFLLNGYPIFAESNVRSENLGYQLMLAGVMDEATHRRSIEIVNAERIRQGEALLRMGVLDREQLDVFLRRQVRERLLNCFGWTGASYGLTYDLGVASQQQRFEVNPLVLIFEGIKSAFPVAPLVTHFDAYPRRVPRVTTKFRDYATLLKEFTDELRVARLCDGRATVGEVIAQSPYGLIDTLRILRALEVTQCVEFGAADAVRAPQPTPTPALRANPASVPPRDSGAQRAVGAAPRDRPSLSPTPTPRQVTTSGGYRAVTQTPPEAPPDLADVRARLEEKLAAARTATHYECLEVPTTATGAQIRNAFDRLSRTWHPDRVAPGDPELTQKARTLYERLSAAYETLVDERRRQQYDALTLAVPTKPAGSKPDILEAEVNFNKGRACLAQNDATKAGEFFDVACLQDPHQARYRQHRAFTRFRVADPRDRKARADALDELKAALVDNGASDDGYVLLGLAQRENGNADLAEQAFRKALELNRRNSEARREIEQIDAARAADKKPKDSGLFGKLFTKK